MLSLNSVPPREVSDSLSTNQSVNAVTVPHTSGTCPSKGECKETNLRQSTSPVPVQLKPQPTLHGEEGQDRKEQPDTDNHHAANPADGPDLAEDLLCPASGVFHQLTRY